MAKIVQTGLNKIALQQGNSLALNVTKFVFANIPGLNHNTPVDINQGLPAAGNIVHQQVKTRQGYVAADKVVYSIVLAPDVGDFSFNWVGLVDADNILIAVSYTPLQNKFKTVGLTLGNTLSRNFLLQFSNAVDITGITVPAESWQLNFMGWLKSTEEHLRNDMQDLYGQQFFFNDSFKVSANAGTVSAKSGNGYVRGLRVAMDADRVITAGVLPRDIYLDVWINAGGSNSNVDFKFTSSPTNTTLVDYVDSAGAAHYVVRIARVNANNTVVDYRITRVIDKALVPLFFELLDAKLEQNQVITISGDATGSGRTAIPIVLKNSGVAAGSYGNSISVPVFTVDAQGRVTNVANTAIRGATTTQTGITQLSSAVNSTSNTQAATSLAVKTAYDLADSKLSENQNITLSGDVIGSGKTAIAVSLTNTGVIADTFGDAVTIPRLTIDAKGRVTAGVKTAIRVATTGQTGITQLNSAVNSSSTGHAATSSAVKAAYDLANSKQGALGFTPVQQGTGVGQLTNNVKIGWSSANKLKTTVDNTDLGNVAFETWVQANFATAAPKPSTAEINAGNSANIRQWSPDVVKQAIDYHAAGLFFFSRAQSLTILGDSFVVAGTLHFWKMGSMTFAIYEFALVTPNTEGSRMIGTLPDGSRPYTNYTTQLLSKQNTSTSHSNVRLQLNSSGQLFLHYQNVHDTISGSTFFRCY